MNLQSWNRFKTRGLTVEPDLMGREASFDFNGSSVTIKIPALERVSDQHDKFALAICDARNGRTGDAIYFHVIAVDVTTVCHFAVDLPEAVLQKPPNAYELVDDISQEKLNAIAEKSGATASSALEYWLSLLRWVTNFHRLGRELRVGSNSGWSTRLHDRATAKPVWAQELTFVRPRVQTVTIDQWQRALAFATKGEIPPLHTTLLDDAKHCIDVGVYRRALVDLSVACEVYLRRAVLNALPSGVLPEVVRLIEEANINQFVAQLFPALLSDAPQEDYEKTIKKDLGLLFDKRNKLMHVAAVEGVNHETCETFLRVLEALFHVEKRAVARPVPGTPR